MSSKSDPDDFWIKLEEKYSNLKHGTEEWSQEHKPLEKIVTIIQEDIKLRYKIIEPLGVGGVGVVLKVEDINLGFHCALKFPRPKVGKETLFTEIVEGEISQLLKARHPNIIEIYYHGSVTFEEKQIPYYIMEYIPGAKDALEYFSSDQRDVYELLKVIKQVVDGMQHLHKMDIIHLDIKLENMLVSSEGRAVISDLGSARSLSEGSEKTLVIFTREYAHPELISLVTYATSTDPNRVRAEVERSKLKRAFDLYALGKSLRKILKLHDATKWKGLDPYSRKYLELMAGRLMDGRNADDECALGMPCVAFREIKYTNIDEVATDIKKITGEYPLHRIIPEMDEHGIRTIQTSSINPTPFSSRMSKIITHPAFRRLGDITQLGFLNLVYPTATHTRFEHSLGTFSNVVRYCNALYSDHVNPLFRQIMNEDDLKAVILAGLLHDLGQFPLAHDFEEAEHNVFSHTEITIEMLEGKYKYLDLPSLNNLISEQWGISSKRVVDIIKADPTDLDCSIKDRILHTIIDSPIDADKLDYLIRDSVNLNVSFGKAIDFERLLRNLTIVFKEEDRKVYVALGIHEKGKFPAETVAFARYAMFGTVYWHHTSRAAEAMLHRALWEALPSKDRKKIKEFQKEFKNFIFGTVKKQTELFQQEKTTLPMSTQLMSSDRKIIEWLADQTTPAGRQILTMIINRDLYKRLLVVSRRRNLTLWDKLIKFRKFDSEMIVGLQQEIQKRVVDLVRTIDNSKRTTSVLEPAATDRVITLSEKGSILILVDIPTGRSGSSISLEYLPESDRQDTIGQWKEPCKLEDSVIWTQLHESFLESAGKIRIFCHPDVRDTLEAAISKNELERLVEASIRHLEKGK